jgi:DDE_Tnp_1-associated
MDACLRGGLLSFLAEIPDPRSRRGRQHPLSAVLALVCCAVMSGAKSYAAIGQWGQDQDIRRMHQLGFTRTPPKAGGIRKVLIALDVKVFEAVLTRWAEATLGQPILPQPAPLEAFALDGKTARGSFDGLERAVHLLALMAHKSGVTLAQAAVPNGVEEKTNEHKTALRLLEKVNLKGRVVTGDAILCQRDLSQQVIDAQGHFLWFVKANQPTLLQDIEAAFAPSTAGAFSPSAATVLE